MTPTESYILVWRLADAIEEITDNKVSREVALDVAYDAVVHINENDLNAADIGIIGIINRTRCCPDS